MAQMWVVLIMGMLEEDEDAVLIRLAMVHLGEEGTTHNMSFRRIRFGQRRRSVVVEGK
jgi:hypothetical protein